VDIGQRPVDGPDDVGQGDVLGRPGEPVAAFSAALAAEQVRSFQVGQDPEEELERDVLCLGDGVGLDRFLGRLRGQLHHRPNGVVDLYRDPHAHQSVAVRGAAGAQDADDSEKVGDSAVVPPAGISAGPAADAGGGAPAV
jgi:hypothetical protein